MLGENVSKETGELIHVDLRRSFDWVNADSQSRVVNISLWKEIQTLWSQRLARRQFMGSHYFRMIQRFKSGPAGIIQKEKEFWMYNITRGHFEFKSHDLTNVKGKYFVREEYLQEALKEEKFLQAGWEVLDDTFTIISTPLDQVCDLVDEASGDVIGGIAGRIKEKVMKNVQNFLVEMFTVKSNIRPCEFKIWQITDQGSTGFLSKLEFYNALRLVTVAQTRREFTPEYVLSALAGPATAHILAPQPVILEQQ
ncbi:hypothetical protein R1sor_026739 [Riccia sorocarpa]|uniref:Uncharacterized protein n=1 Tax=Riccia sorocarpa TaxID=122646 RepID=A0ABD3GDR4_9MARC